MPNKPMMHSAKLSLLVLLFLSISCESTRKKIERADKLSEQGKFEEAIKIRTEILDKDIDNIEQYINRGADKSCLGKYKEAIIDYKMALEIDSNKSIALLNIGKNYARLNENIIAIEYFTKALTLAYEDQDLKFVKNDYFDFTHLNTPENEVTKKEVLLERGFAYLNNGKYEQAIFDLEEGINTLESYVSKNEEYGNYFYWIGFCYSKIKNKEKACEYLRKALRTDLKISKEEIYENCK
jgi:tetratricopeptide (TPR) repeat protein